MMWAPVSDDLHLMIGSALFYLSPPHWQREATLFSQRIQDSTAIACDAVVDHFPGTVSRGSRYSAVYADVTVGTEFTDRPCGNGGDDSSGAGVVHRFGAFLSDAESLTPLNGPAVDPTSRDHSAARRRKGSLGGRNVVLKN